jgi:hypothetical protein
MSTYDLGPAYSIEVFSLARCAGPRMTGRMAGDLRALARRSKAASPASRATSLRTFGPTA